MTSALTPLLKTKLARVRRALLRTGGCAVAFSGGVDSGLLTAIAHETLGDRCLAVLGVSPVEEARETAAALAWLRRAGIPHAVVHPGEMQDARFRANPENRCYYCKGHLLRAVRTAAAARGLRFVADGSNAEDRRQIRPGRRALAEAGALRPLESAGLTKAEIRVLAGTVYGLPMAEKPSNPCLASRVAFGLTITPELLRRIEAMEAFLRRRGLRTFRARVHPGELLRLELGPDGLARLGEPAFRRACAARAKRLGFVQVTADLQGFRSGSGHDRGVRPGRGKTPRKRS